MSAKKPFLIGLTGSIGMGKSTTADMFRELGIPVWDADAAVHRIYANGGAAIAAFSNLDPRTIVNGAVDRNYLKRWISEDESALAQIEAIVHPLVAADRADFIEQQTSAFVVLDIPLLFEKGTQVEMDMVVVVSTSADEQRRRILERGGMTEGLFETILAKQTPDAEKRARADVVIPTDTIEGARQAVQDLVTKLKADLKNA